MREDSPRWEEVRHSQWPHERVGLTHIRALLPEADPYHAWANVEFEAIDGSVNEVGLLVLTPSGLHLVELKHWAGKVAGNGTLWTRRFPKGNTQTVDNPLIAANRKARKLGSLLDHYARKASGPRKPFVKASIFLHAPNTVSELDEVGRINVFGLETNSEDGLPGIITGLLTKTPKDAAEAIDRPRGREVVKLVKDAGIRPSVAHRKVGALLLHPKPYAEGPGWQDFLAGHEVETDLLRRVRFYLTSRATAEQRAILQRAAQREFRLLLGVHHPGIARAVDLVDHEIGPAVVFEHDESAVRLDHWLAERRGVAAGARRGADAGGAATFGGRLHLDLLERYGKDLLDIAAYLDGQGVTHRDIKPHNLASRPRPKDRQPHLAIFDFSLARTPADQLQVGTAQYLDPFLGPPRRPTYDPAAERFAVAVTLYEMATGELPQWGDAVANPAQLDCEVTIARERLDPAVAEPLAAFFAKALERDARRRFDTVEDMTREWLTAFQAVEPAATAEPPDEQGAPEVTPATPLSETGLTVRALSALERFEVATVGELLEVDPLELSRLEGVSQATKREISRRAKEWRKLLSQPAPPAEEAGEDSESTRARGIETVVRSLVPGSNGRNATEIRTVRLLLGLTDPEGTAAPMRWPSQTEVASAIGVTGPRVNQVAAKVRARWARSEQLGQARDEVVELLDNKGGVMAAHELAEALVAFRGTFAQEPVRTTQALGLVRAAVEAELERGGDARVDLRRLAEVVLMGREPDDPTGEPAAVRLDYAVELGRVARTLAEAEPLPSAARVVERLRTVEPPNAMPALDDTRLVHLAAAASGSAATSGQLQLYPAGMPAHRTLRLVAGGLVLPPGRGLNVTQLRKRVAARFPEAAPLPDRPELDRLLAQAEVPLEWNGEVYVTPAASTPSIFSTATRTPGRGGSAEPASATAAEVEEVGRRLSGSLRAQSFLALLVRPRQLSRARRILLSLHRLTEVDVTRELLTALRSLDGVAWDLVVRSDAREPSHADRRSLEMAVRQTAVPRIEEAIESASEPVLLTKAAPLARYGCMDLLAKLADPSVPQPAARWLLLPADSTSALPMLDDEPVPVLSDSQWLRLPSAWYAASEAEAS